MNLNNVPTFSFAIQLIMLSKFHHDIFIVIGFVAHLKLLFCAKLSWERKLYGPVGSRNYFKGYIIDKMTWLQNSSYRESCKLVLQEAATIASRE